MQTIDPYQVTPLPEETPNTKNKSMMKYLKYAGIVLGAVLLIVGLGFAGYYYGTKQNAEKPANETTNTSNQTQNTNESAANDNSTNEKAKSTTYTYKTFSFEYPDTWNVFDSKSNPDFFTENNLDIYDFGVIAQQEDYMLFFAINDTQNLHGGGIFLTSDEEETFKSVRTKLSIQGEEFYLGKEHFLLSNLTSEDATLPVNQSTLEQFQAKKVTNDNGTFNGYTETIEKGSYDYLIEKIYSGTSSNVLTPEAVQQEMVDILETIKW
ncbi:hypothetical protein KC660_01330 [Candidatus Dojkabacteria bacterium]|uniref:Uncharacterized protein n=1 Tax=Candidatus Dojkabacteria bacterium TaxID=2099670 RepID=A0A955RHK3_9BACT|nr:hypothetical protein [Candidatus Dojkabacteria bacterium]